MPGLQDALTEVRNLDPGDKLVYTNIAQKHGVSRTTLSRAHHGVQVPQGVADPNQRKLTPQQEADLVQYIETLSARHLPPTRTMVQNFASKVAQDHCSDS
jgi:membrane-bound lytic murein transglycosylase B